MPRPSAIPSKKGAEILRRSLAGESARALATEQKLSPTTVAKQVAEHASKAAKERKKLARGPVQKPRPETPPKEPSKKADDKPAEETKTDEEILAEELSVRLEIREGLRVDFKAAAEQRDRVLVAEALSDQLTSIRQLLAPSAPTEDEDEDESPVDGVLERYLGKMVAVNEAAGAKLPADEGVPAEAEPAGAVGDRAPPPGLH